jgi:hypothetical protein
MPWNAKEHLTEPKQGLPWNTKSLLHELKQGKPWNTKSIWVNQRACTACSFSKSFVPGKTVESMVKFEGIDIAVRKCPSEYNLLHVVACIIQCPLLVACIIQCPQLVAYNYPNVLRLLHIYPNALRLLLRIRRKRSRR